MILILTFAFCSPSIYAQNFSTVIKKTITKFEGNKDLVADDGSYVESSSYECFGKLTRIHCALQEFYN